MGEWKPLTLLGKRYVAFAARGRRGGQQFFRMSCPFESLSRGFVRVSAWKNGGGAAGQAKGEGGTQEGGGDA